MTDVHPDHIIAVPRPAVVLVVDDQRAVREGLARLLSVPGRRIVVSAATSDEALEAAKAHLPDVVVLDVDLDGDDGLALLPALRDGASVVILTSHGDAVTRARALALGARAFVEKDSPATMLLGHVASFERDRDISPIRRG
jgi:DNA-binding NarL/FixJ family response regulator